MTSYGKEVTFPNDRDTLYLRWANGNHDAAQVLLLVGTSCQVADDIVDERQMPDPSGKMLDLLLMFGGALQRNGFFMQHRKTIEPVMLANIVSWDLANTLVAGPEKGSRNDRIYSYVYRELIEQVVGIVALLTGGIAHARKSILESHAFHHVLNVEKFEEFEAELLGSTT